MRSFGKYLIIGIIKFIVFMIIWSVCFRLFANWDQWRKNQEPDFPSFVRVYDYQASKVVSIILKEKKAESKLFDFVQEGCEEGGKLMFCTEKVNAKEYRVSAESTTFNDYMIKQEYIIRPDRIQAIRRYVLSPGHLFTMFIPTLIIWWFIKRNISKVINKKYLILSN